MADEINRASPRTQSALLQAMQERRVTIAGRAHPLPEPFHVLATQNPLEQEGTYPLPEAQLDRFLLQIDVGYPDVEAERQMLIATTGSTEDKPQPGDDRRRADRGAAADPAHPGRRERGRGDPEPGARRPARRRRPRPRSTRHVAWGPGPRASQALMLACAPAPRWKAGCRPRSTTCWRWPIRCCAIAWPSTSPRAPMASPWTR